MGEKAPEAPLVPILPRILATNKRITSLENARINPEATIKRK